MNKTLALFGAAMLFASTVLAGIIEVPIDQPGIPTIEFAVPKSVIVTLMVYNLLGQEVATLVAEQREAGIYKINWDAKGLASGVYVYRLEAGDFVQVKKLILMR